MSVISGWLTVYNAPTMIPELLTEAVDAIAPQGVTHIGFVPTDIDGKVLLCIPHKSVPKVTATFPKKRQLAGEMASRTLERCIAESLGKAPDSVYPLRGTWITPNSSTYYFVGLVEYPENPASTESGRLLWATPEEATQLIGSSNPMSKLRDLAVLTAAGKECASPHRRILLMLGELHRMGFERLRAPAYDYPLAWRCPIVPAAWTHREHGGTFEDPSAYIRELFGEKSAVLNFTYSSASGQSPFDWTDATFATPRELALRFIKECPAIALAGWGPDREYAAWFERMLEMTAPNGVITSAFADYGPGTTTFLYTHYTRVETVPLPPPGGATEGEFDNMTERLKNQGK